MAIAAAARTAGDDGELRLALRHVHVDGRRGALLDLRDLTLATGECLLLAGEPGQGNSALALVATGRLRPTRGTVTLTGADGPVHGAQAALRAASAVVDLPGVSEPDDVLTVRTVVAEGLALARRRADPWAVRRWLHEHQLWEHRERRIDDVYGPARTALLTSLAAESPHVRFLVLTLPDRHGGEAAGWWAVARTFAGRGYGVLVLASRSSARDLGATLPATRGDQSRTAPREALRLRPGPLTGAQATAEILGLPEDPESRATRSSRSGQRDERTADG